LPTFITLAMVVIAAGVAVSTRRLPEKFRVLSVLCAVLPDIDVVFFKPGTPYGHFFGHRGLFYSIFYREEILNVAT
jgi:inner membrane protein